MVRRVGAPGRIVAVSMGRSRDPRQRRVAVLWVKACGGQVFVDPTGRRFALFDVDAAPRKTLLHQRETRLMDDVPPEWVRLA